MHRPCPNSAYNFYQASTGRVMGLSRQHDDGSHFLPPLVMAKRDGYDMLGLLVPKLLAFDAGCSNLNLNLFVTVLTKLLSTVTILS